jgi:DNA replication and repair protein RecF
MRLQRVVINHIRNLKDVSIDLSDHLNIIFGENASGKTSLLESLHVLAYAKSFRSHHFRHIINHDAQYLRVTGQIGEPGQLSIPVGVEFREGRLRMRADGRNLKKTSELAQHLPIIIIHQECQRLLTDGPKFRRKFLDWGVFHVEQRFLNDWRRYVRALRQRNTVLQARKGRAAVCIWDKELQESAMAIHSYRQSYCDQLIPVWQDCFRQLLDGCDDVTVTYQAGWNLEQDFTSALKSTYEQDARRGFTHQGPHRADLAIRVAGIAAHESLSRGQQKLLICAMLIAQALVFRRLNNRPCVFLVDDIKAELDQEHVERVMALLKNMDAQIIMTATEKEVLEPFCFSGDKTFHVERGHVTEVV